jgi:pimeloyl-ACP methyl ester carboxylesterase
MFRILKFFVATILLMSAALAGVLAAYSVPDRPVDELKPRWTNAHSQFVDIEGMQLHLRDEGSRDDPMPIVLLHGTSASLHTWDGWVDELKAQHRVIRYDMPGFGLTGPAPDSVYSVERYAKTVIAVLDELGIEECLLGGNSLGGYVAWATAVLYPERVKQLVLVDPSGLPFESQSIPLGFKIAQTPILKELMKGVLPRFVIQQSVENVFGDRSLVTAELVDRYFELTTRAGNRLALAERFKQTQPGAMATRLPEIDIPTLVLWGEQDRLIPPALASRFEHEIKNSQVILFDKLGHVPHEEDPIGTVAMLKGFLSQLPR